MWLVDKCGAQEKNDNDRACFALFSARQRWVFQGALKSDLGNKQPKAAVFRFSAFLAVTECPTHCQMAAKVNRSHSCILQEQAKANVIYNDKYTNIADINQHRIFSIQCTMVPLLTRICLKSNKLRPILNGQFYHAIFKNIGLNLFGSKQPREILVFVILKL